ncbi:MAG: phycobilisome linker polypeptide [Phormidesmis sp.]
MLGQCANSAASSSDSRVFVYEVAGLSQNEASARSRSPIRSSSNQFIQVPFARMNEEMQRITAMQGSIVNIFPLDAFDASQRPSPKESPKDSSSAAEPSQEEASKEQAEQ